MQRPFLRIFSSECRYKTLGKKNDAIAIQNISNTLFAVRSLKFEPVSGTHELNALMFQLAFKPTPIVTGLRIVRLIINSAYNVR